MLDCVDLSDFEKSRCASDVSLELANLSQLFIQVARKFVSNLKHNNASHDFGKGRNFLRHFAIYRTQNFTTVLNTFLLDFIHCIGFGGYFGRRDKSPFVRFMQLLSKVYLVLFVLLQMLLVVLVQQERRGHIAGVFFYGEGT